MFGFSIERIVLSALSRQNGHSHLWRLSSADWGTCGHCAGQALACGAFRVRQVWEALPGPSALREARPGLLWDALSSALWQSVFRLQSGHRRRWYVESEPLFWSNWTHIPFLPVVFTALNKAWCVHHFACSVCDTKMTQKSKFYEYDEKPVCKKCYERFPNELRRRLRTAHEMTMKKTV